MKILNVLFIGILFTVFGCVDSYIDDIKKVDPGPDADAPAVTINYPAEGTEIQVPAVATDVEILFEVTDDIRIQSVSVSMDGAEIASYSDFIDYRKLIVEDLVYEGLLDGDHVLKVTATDSDGKVTTSEVNFAKSPPYIPLYDGEVLYLPLDGDYMDLLTFQQGTQVGSPGFAGESVVGLNSYAGFANSYLTFPAADLMNDEFSAVFWLKIDNVPDRAGILVIGPPDEANAGFPDTQNLRSSGFRFFRENAAGMQRFKLNVGNGTADTWFDGGAAADVDPSTGNWVHFGFTISQTESKVYIDGELVKEGTFDGVAWDNCDILSIMSGAPRFTGWGHFSDLSYMDELRIFDRVLSQSEIQDIRAFEAAGGGAYEPKYDGETLYMSFEGHTLNLIGNQGATVVGSPGFDAGKVGQAFAGNTDSYLQFDAAQFQGDEFSAAFWMKINATPDRAGIMVMGPPDSDNPSFPDVQNDRTSGFRFFRENAGGMQRFKLNVGDGTADTWFDGGAAADVDPTVDQWHHFAFTISQTESKVYVDGVLVKEGTFGGVDWTGCDVLSIMSGAPRFTEWNHKSDLSLLDELRLFNKALSQSEIQTIIDDES